MATQESGQVISLCARRRVRDQMSAIRPKEETFVAEGIRFSFTITHSTAVQASGVRWGSHA